MRRKIGSISGNIKAESPEANELAFELRTCPIGWIELWDEFKFSADRIAAKVAETKYYPTCDNILNAYKTVTPKTVKVVIIGTNPHCQTVNINGEDVPKDIGLAYSQRRDDPNLTPSLNNIYAEIKKEYPEFVIPNHGDLTHWHEQGVMLLNMILTVKPDLPGSCSAKLWSPLIDKTVSLICRENRDVIFLLWGNTAKSLKRVIPKNIKVLEAASPSALSAHKGFFGCGHFREVNEILGEKGHIDWTVR